MKKLLNSKIISPDQKESLFISLYESIYLVDICFDNDGFILKLTGSTLNIYTVCLKKYNLTCNCGYKTQINNLFCKHICFVICVIGKIKDDELVFYFNKLSLQQKLKIIDRLKNYCYNEPNIINNYLTEKYKIKLNLNKKDCRNIQDDCGICFLKKKDDDIFKCENCLNWTHRNCILKWLKYDNTCIYCRYNIIKHKYLNISN